MKIGKCYNEFKVWMAWKEIVSIWIMDIPLIVIRHYTWLDKNVHNYLIGIFGFQWVTKPKYIK